MAQAARQLDTRAGDDWVTAEQAAELTGLSVRAWQLRARSEAAKSRGGRTLAYKAPPVGGGKSVWFVHRSLDSRLSRCPARKTRDERTVEALSAKFASHAVDKACRKNRWVQRWKELCDGADGRVTEAALAAKVCEEAGQHDPELKISVRSLSRWRRNTNAVNAGGSIRSVEALVDKHHGPGFGGGSGGGPTWSPEAIAFYYELYHTHNCLSIKVCHDVTLSESQRRGWQWPASYAATTAWLGKNDDLSMTCLLREGKDRWCRKYMPHLEFDYSKLQPGAVYLSDHTQCDFWVTYKGKQIRPWLTAVIDSASRRVVGTHLGPSPHQDAILSALRMAFRDCAIPEKLHIDQGKDFTSKLITGMSKRERDAIRRELGVDWQAVLKRESELVSADDPRWLGLTGELGIAVKFAIPYSPWSKAIVERWFKTFHDQFGRTVSTYCGSSVLKRPACLAEIKTGYSRDQRRRLKKLYGNDWPKHVVLKLIDESAVPTMEEARTRISEYLDIFHRTAHRGNGMKGRTPLEVWDTASSLRLAVEDDLLCLMNVRGLYRVGANGVSLKIGEARLNYGGQSLKLRRWKGRQVLVAVDNEDVSQAWALTPDRKKRELIDRLDPNERIEPYTTADDAREAIAEMKRDQIVMHKAQRCAAKRTRSATQAINRHTRAQRIKLMATGTDGRANNARIMPVLTGFDGASMPDRRENVRPPSEYDDISLDDLDLSDGNDEPLVMDDGDDTSLDDIFLDSPEEDTSDD